MSDSIKNRSVTPSEQAQEIEAWKARPRTQTEEAKGKQAEYFKMLEARKRPDNPLYVHVQSGKAFRPDGSFR